jgi:hypothetical protein
VCPGQHSSVVPVGSPPATSDISALAPPPTQGKHHHLGSPVSTCGCLSSKGLTKGQ